MAAADKTVESSLRNWATHLDKWIAEKSVKVMKVSLFTELKKGDLEEVKTAPELFFALQRQMLSAGHSLESILSRFIFALNLAEWGHIAVSKLSEYKVGIPPPFQEVAMSDEFKLRLCLAKVYAEIVRKKSCERHIIARCSTRFAENPKTFPDIYSLLAHMLQNGHLTMENQRELFDSLAVNEHSECTEIINNYRSETKREKLTLPDALAVADMRVRCPSCGLEMSTGVDKISISIPMRTKEQDKRVSVAVSEGNRNSTAELIPEEEESPRKELSYKGHAGQKKLSKAVLLLMATAILCLLCTLSAVFLSSIVHNHRHMKQLHSGGAVAIVAEVNHFFTSQVTITEDAHNIGDTNHRIDLYHFPQSCKHLPITSEEYNHTSSLPQKIVKYILKGSTIKMDIEAAASTSNISRTDIILFTGLDAARNNFDIHSKEKTDFQYFFEREEYSYRVSRTNYYVLHFLKQEPTLNYNYTLRVDKNIDLQTLPQHCSLRKHRDNCSFNFTFTTGSSCLVADVESKQTTPSFVHLQTERKSRQGNAIVGAVMGCLLLATATTITITLSVTHCIRSWSHT